MALFGTGGGFPRTQGTAGSNTILMANYSGMTISSSAVNLTNVLVPVPFFVPAVTTVDGLVFENTGTGDNTETVRLSLYGSTSSGLPGALLGETGVITLDATAAVRIGAITPVTLLPTERYWIALNGASSFTLLIAAQSTATVGAETLMTRSGFPPWNAGFGSYSTNAGMTIYKTHAFGAAPSPFGTPTGPYVLTGIPVLGAQVQ